MMKFYDLLPISSDSKGGWSLLGKGIFDDGMPLTLENIWEYSKCKYIDNPLPVPLIIYKDGIPLDINHEGSIPLVVSKRAGDVIESVAPNDIQRIPAKVEGDQGEWEVINILHAIKCVDYEKSIIDYHPPDHSRHPNGISAFFKLVIDPSNVVGHHIFQIAEYRIIHVISEILLQALREINATGLGVTQVYPNDGHIPEEVENYLKVKASLNLED